LQYGAQALSAFLNERSDLPTDVALRIEVALGPKADVMMGVQTDYDMGAPALACPRSRPRSAGSHPRRPDRRRPRPHAGELAAEGAGDNSFARESLTT
jgi:hypothetical protein